jgi:hypothetical protein
MNLLFIFLIIYFSSLDDGMKLLSFALHHLDYLLPQPGNHFLVKHFLLSAFNDLSEIPKNVYDPIF